jgi:plastocyanin
MYAPGAMGRGLIAVGLAGALSLAAPALAGQPDRTVVATSGNEFFPKTLTVVPGTKVDWENRGLLHNVKFEDGKFEQPPNPQATPWRVWRRFDKPGVYRYYCEMHGGPGGKGMSGLIRVEKGAAPRLTKLTVKPRKVCRRKTRKCRRAKAVIRFRLSEPSRVSGFVEPVGKPPRKTALDVDFKGRRGRNTFRVAVRRLKPGRYRLTLSAEDADGNESAPRKAFFRVRRAKR